MNDRFRVLALKYHPLRNPKQDLASNSHVFSQICEAYDVLSNRKPDLSLNTIAERKQCYDKYGEYGMKEGVYDTKGSKF